MRGRAKPIVAVVDVAVDARLLPFIVAGLRPEPMLTVSEWADAKRVLTAKSSEPGPWRTSRTPYLREILDSLSVQCTDVREVAAMFASQLGKSEVANNWIGYIIDIVPAPILMVQPTEELAERYVRARINPMIRAVPTLRRAVEAGVKSGGADNLNTKDYPGGELTVVGANAPGGLASAPKRFVIHDEVGRYPQSSGDEGNVMAIADRRMATYGDRAKTYLCSSPGVAGDCQMHARYLQGDRRRYYVPCPHCDHRQILHFFRDPQTGAGLVWDPEDPAIVHYQCEGCGALIDHAHKDAMLASGEWRATARAQVPGLRSYQLSALYSPWLSWAALVADFLSSKDTPTKLQVFVNTLLGEPWEEERQEEGPALELAERREPYGAEVPGPVQVLTAGVDVQEDRLEVTVWGWGWANECWAIEHLVIDGGPDAPESWVELDRFLLRPRARKDGRELPVLATAVDSGYKTQRVYDYCRPRARRRVWAVKGMTGKGELWPDRPTKFRSKKNGKQIKLYPLRHDVAKQELWSWLRRPPGGPASLHLPAAPWCTDDWCRQLTTERRKRVQNKQTGEIKYVWVKEDGKRNEAWDILVYAYAALVALTKLGLRLHPPTRPEPKPAPVDAKVPTHPRPTTAPRRPAPDTNTKGRERADPRRFARV